MSIKTTTFYTAALLIGLSACTKKEDAEAAKTAPEEAPIIVETDNEATTDEGSLGDIIETVAVIDEDAPKADGKERFYGKKSFTIVSEQTGAEAGAVTEYVRDWGRTRAEVKDTTMSIAGFSQATNQRVIYEGDKITTIDETTGSVTTATNPLYDSMVARMKGKTGVEYGKELMAQMGGRETGEKAKFAGVDCEYWEIAAAGTKACVTSWGGTLHTVTNMAGISIEKTATEIRMNDGGPDSAFAFDASKATAAPNLQDIMKQMKQAQPKD